MAKKSQPKPDHKQSFSSSKFHIEDLKHGKGDREVQGGDYVAIHYKGILLNGTEFDSSYKLGKPFKTRIGVGEVIEGWDMGVPGMKVGGKRRLTIPAKLAYGERAMDIIPANSTLIFEVELIGIE